MLRIIETVSPPIHLYPHGDPETFLPGKIGSLIEIDNTPKITLCSGEKPFGIIGEMDMGLILVFLGPCIAQTSQYEPDCRYKPGYSLYVSKKGLLTTNKIFPNSLLVGHVISWIDARRDYLELNFI